MNKSTNVAAQDWESTVGKYVINNSLGQYRVLLLYHGSDLDGAGSAAIVYTTLTQHALWTRQSKMVPIDYEYELGDGDVDERTIVIMCDMTVAPILNLCRERAAEVIWIDHHKAAYEQAEADGLDLPGLRASNVSAIVLTWKYFRPQSSIPRAVQLLSDYDIHNFTEGALPTQPELINSIIQADGGIDPLADIWNTVFYETPNQHNLYNLLSGGQVSFAAIAMDDRRRRKFTAFRRKLFGFDALIANDSCHRSRYLSDECLPSDQLLLLFYITADGKFAASIYRPPECAKLYDAAELARRLGGNGHPGAAGFTCELEKGLALIGLSGKTSDD